MRQASFHRFSNNFYLVASDSFRKIASRDYKFPNKKICSFPRGNGLGRSFSDDIPKSARHIECWVISSVATYGVVPWLSLSL
jgi:hypothetical protein